MNATNSSADTTAAEPGQQPEDQAEPDDHLDARAAGGRPVGTTASGQQLVGAHGADARGGVGELERAGDDPDPARDQTRDQPDPVRHARDARPAD